MSRLKDLPKEDYPREKALKYGINFLTTSELIAIILGSGTKGLNVLELSKNLLGEYKTLSNLSKCDVNELISIKGLNKIKALQLLSSLQLAQKFQKELIPPITLKNYNSKHIYDYFIHYYLSKTTEIIYIILLNHNGFIIKTEILTNSINNLISFDPLSIVKIALKYKSRKIIIIHNHLNHNIEPTFNDLDSTLSIQNELKRRNILLLDHLIIADNIYFSFRDNFLLTND